MKKIRFLSLLLAIAMLVTLLSGCGSSAQNSTAESAEAASEAAEATEAAEEAEEAVEAADSEAAPADTGSAAEAEEETAEAEKPAPVELPLTEDEVTFTLFAGANPNALATGKIDVMEDGLFWKELESRTGIHIEIGAIHPATQAENFNLLMASQDYPDFTYNISGLYPGGMGAAMDADVIIDLSEYVDECPNYQYQVLSDSELYQDVIMDDGSIGCFYNVYPEAEYMDQGAFIRSDWLDALGMDMPETFDEYYEVAKAFKNEYNATVWIPAGGSMTYGFLQSGYDVYAGYATGMSTSLDCFYVKDGNVVCGFLEDGFGEWLEMMNKWYDEGLIYQDYISGDASSLTLSNNSDMVGELTQGAFGIWTDEVAAVSSYLIQNPDFECAAAINPTKNSGDVTHVGYYTSRINISTYSISTQCEDPDLAVQWVDYWYSDEGSLLANWGIEGETFEYDEDGTPYLTELLTDNPEDLSFTICKFIYLADNGPFVYDRRRDNQSYNEMQLSCQDVWSSNYDAEWTLSSELSYTTDETERRSALTSDIITYVAECMNKFITGSLNLDSDLADFQDNLRSMGIDELIEIEQASYERWLAR